MIAVIFEIWPKPGQKQRYLDLAAELRPLLDTIDGFISIERFESLYEPGKMLSLSFFRDEAAVSAWRNLEPHRRTQALGRAEVRQVFNVPGATIAGSMVLDGKVMRNARTRLVRDGRVVWEGKIGSLRRFKDDAREVAAGYECGIGLENFNDVKPGDIVETFEMEAVLRKLGAPSETPRGQAVVEKQLQT